MALAPLFDTGDIIIDLKTPLPGQEIAAHQEIIERSDAHQPEQLRYGLCYDGILKVVCFHCLEHVVEQTEKIVHAESWGRIALEKLA